jgi:hypothetical protein
LTGLDTARYMRPMTARQQWSQGLQWGGCAWLCYVVAHSVIDLVCPGWRTEPLPDGFPPRLWEMRHVEMGWWPAASWLTTALWLLAVVLVAAGARRARPAVALAILAQAALGVREAARFLASAASSHYETSWQPVVLVVGLFVPVCLAALPLVFLPVTRPREVLARMARGRWREAWDYTGGPGVLTVAIAVPWLHVGLRDALEAAHEGYQLMNVLHVAFLSGHPWWIAAAISLVLAATTVWAAAFARTMRARAQWSLGLQWGGCAWLVYVVFHTVLDLVYPTWRSDPDAWSWLHFHLETGWPAGSWLVAALWLLAVGMVAAGAGRARSAVVVAIVAQTALGLHEAVSHPADMQVLPFPESKVALVLGLFVPVCLPALPLAFLRVTRPRLAIAQLALGRWREAREQAGGVGVLMVTIAVLCLHVGLRDLLEDVFRTGGAPGGFLIAFDSEYGELDFFREWWLVTVIFLALASVTVWAAASAECAKAKKWERCRTSR